MARLIGCSRRRNLWRDVHCTLWKWRRDLDSAWWCTWIPTYVAERTAASAIQIAESPGQALAESQRLARTDSSTAGCAATLVSRGSCGGNLRIDEHDRCRCDRAGIAASRLRRS